MEIKAFIDACFGTLKSCKISHAQSKSAVNVHWYVSHIPQCTEYGMGLFVHIGVDVCCLFLCVGSCRNLRVENRQR